MGHLTYKRCIYVENTPTLLFIYSIKTLRLVCILQQVESIKHMEWQLHEHKKHVLVFCTGTENLYFWDGSRSLVSQEDSDDESAPAVDKDGMEEPYGVAESITIPCPDFHVNMFRWSLDGKRVMVMDKTRFCLGFEVAFNDEQLL
jgi:hypothetical protein